MSDKIREELAAYAHQQWTGWMDYLFSKCQQKIDGTMIIPKWAVDRWKDQIITDYQDLSETEKDADRAEADGMIKIISIDPEMEKNLEIIYKSIVAEDYLAAIELLSEVLEGN